ncbi:type II toxin-antitoxin system toxin TscT [Enterobacter hormaechei]|uniref:Pathogenicity island protein n=1 Tax=Enterobacter hormaechei TaxID=158836 RepID=A0AAP8KL54_9ENTR|nr:pathogenicity island protein [Enterobacter hormaechei]
MNREIKDLMCDIEVIKEKINDVAIKHGWFVEDKFVKNELETKQEHINFSASYLEHRIQNEHTVELLQVYLKEFGELIQKFYEIEKASSENFGEESDDAKNLIKLAE